MHMLMNFVLKECDQFLHRASLYEAVLATHVSFRQSHQNFFGLLESNNPDTRSFFTPAGELGMTYHEMHYVSGLMYSEYPYEERFYLSSEIESKAKTKGLSTYLEFLCHFHIYMDTEKRHKGGISFAKWVHYLVSDDLKALEKRRGIPLS